MADSRQPLPTNDVLPTSDVMIDDREDYDATSLISRDELAHDEIDDLLETASTISAAATVVAETGPTVASDVLSSADSVTAATSQVSSSSPSKSRKNNTSPSVADPPQNTLVESAAGLQNGLPASIERLPVTNSCNIVVPPSKSFESSSSVYRPVTALKSLSISSRMEPVQTVATSVDKVTTPASTSKMAAVPPLAKKGLTHLLSSSSALFHRKRQLRADADAKNLSVGYSTSSMSLVGGQSESVTLSDSSASSAEAGSESQTTQSPNSDSNVVPIVCGDVTFLMVKDDFCQKPTDLLAVDKNEDTLSVTSSCKDSGLSLKTSSLPSNEKLNVTNKNDKSASDPASVGSHQVSAIYVRTCCHNIHRA